MSEKENLAETDISTYARLLGYFQIGDERAWMRQSAMRLRCPLIAYPTLPATIDRVTALYMVYGPGKTFVKLVPDYLWTERQEMLCFFHRFDAALLK